MHFDWSTLALQTANFAVLVWLLHRFLYKPVLRAIDARKAAVQKQYDDAKAVETLAHQRLAEVEAARSGIAAEREATLKEAAAQGRTAAEAVRQRAELERQQQIEAARKSLAAEREEAVAEMQSSALDLAAAFSQRFMAAIPVQLRAEAWLERIETHLRSMAPAGMNDFTRQLSDKDALRVVTAETLPGDIAKVWSERLSSALSSQSRITFETNPGLIAGVELHSPTAILRFSLQTLMTEMRTEIGVNGHTG